MKFALLILSALILSSLQAALPARSWLDSGKSGDRVLLLRQLPAQIMRYDLTADQWLDPVALDSEPTAFAFDDDYYYVGYSRQAVRIRRSDGRVNHLTNTSNEIRWIAVTGEHIWVSDGTNRLFDKSTLALVAEGGYHYSLRGISSNPLREELFGRSTGVSPSDIHRIAWDGERIIGRDSPYHGDYGSGQETWTFPDGNRVADDSGTVYHTVDLRLSGSLGARFWSMDFTSDSTVIVLREGSLTSYDNWLRSTGSLDITDPWVEIYVHGEEVHGFFNDSSAANGIGVTAVALADLDILPTSPVLDPREIDFAVTDHVTDPAGSIYLLSKDHFNVFIWSAETRDWERSLPLRSTAELIAYAPATDRLYVYNANRELTYFDLSQPEPVEQSFANLPYAINAMIPMEEELWVGQNGSWDLNGILGADGQFIVSNFRCCYDAFYAFNPVNRRLYMNIGSTGYWPYLGDGQLGDFVSGGYFSSYNYQPFTGMADDASLLVTGNGYLISGETMKELGVLSNNVHQALWIDHRLFSIEKVNTSVGASSTTVQKWSEYYVFEKSLPVSGSFITSYVHDRQIIVLTAIAGRPRFYVLDEELQMQYSQPLYTLDPALLQVEAVSDTSVTLSWDLSSHGDSEFNLQFYHLTDGWITLARVDAVSTGYLVDELPAGRLHEYRLTTLEKLQESEVAAEMSLSLDVTANYYSAELSGVSLLKLQKWDNGEWKDLREEIPGGSLQLMETEFGPGDSMTDLRLAYEAHLTTSLSAPLTQQQTVLFNWLRSPYGQDGFVLSKLDIDTETRTVVATMDAETFTYGIPFVSQQDALSYRLEALDGEATYPHHISQASLRTQLEWQDEGTAPLSYRIEFRPNTDYPWFAVEDVDASARSSLIQFIGVQQLAGEFRVMRVEESLGMKAISPLTWYTSVFINWNFPQGIIKGSLQLRTDPTADWLTVREYTRATTSDNRSRSFSEPIAYPEARLITVETIPAATVGYASALTTQSIESTRITGLKASDGTHLRTIGLEWNPEPKATAYKVLRSTSTSVEQATEVATVQADEGPAYNDTQLPEDSLYYYWVRATDGTLYGMLSIRETGSTGQWDADGDGIPLPLEQYLGSDANGHDMFGRVVSLQFLDGQWSLIFPRAYDTDRHAFKIQWSSDLLDWHSTGVVFGEPQYDDSHILEKVTIEAGSSDNLFVRFLEN